MKKEDIRSLQKGDVVIVSREVVVDRNGGKYSITSDDGTQYFDREAHGTYTGLYWDSPSNIDKEFIYDIKLVRKAAPVPPQHWPPQNGDVWRDKDDTDWHCVDLVTDCLYSSGKKSGNQSIQFTQLQKLNPVLVYRRGNSGI
jgi:hypothetical protein